jgi:hypothetical protein
MLKKYQISVSSCPIFATPNTKSRLETEALFGEVFFIKKSITNWSFGFLHTDGYYGWIKTKHLERYSTTNYKVTVVRTIVLSRPDVKSSLLFYLPLCSLINVVNISNEWAEIHFLKKNLLKIGYVYNNHVHAIGFKINNWINTAHNLMNIPYKWGGRDTLSLDCSSLVQLISNTQNILMPRNTSDQVIFLKKNYKHLLLDTKHFLKQKLLKKGCLIYWEGHVAISINENMLLHANVFHNNVNSEKIEEAVKRLFNYEIKIICQLFN